VAYGGKLSKLACTNRNCGKRGRLPNNFIVFLIKHLTNAANLAGIHDDHDDCAGHRDIAGS
jgi:hypothetical protein